MKSGDNVEKLIEKANAVPSVEMNRRTLNDIFEAQEKSRKVTSATFGPNVWRIIMKGRITKIAIAAMIVVAAIIVLKNYNDSVDLVSLSKAAPVIWPVTYGGNGHYYLPIATPYPISWSDANAVANMLGGHLATITSVEENDFVFSLIDDEIYWYPSVNIRGPWIGGYQLPGSTEPDGGWAWVTGEPFVYANWDLGQPNNYQGHGRQGQDETRIQFGNKKIRVPTWNDVAIDFEEIRAYIVELSDPNSLPVEWPIANGGNGHTYLAVEAPNGITWVQANSAANLAGGYLATITSAEESDFVAKLISDEKYWVEYTLDTSAGPWIGGYQLPGSLEPDGGWQWVIYEPFAYTNWEQGKPDNLQVEGTDENCLHFLRLNKSRARVTVWNDLPHDYVGIFGYVIEFYRGVEDIAGDFE